jgi:carbamoyltransferase
MIVLGINAGITKKGRPLNDGGAALIVNGKIACAIQEERLTRVKYDSGFEKSIKYVCDTAKVEFSEIDKVIVTSCIDGIWSKKEAMEILKLKEKYGFSEEKVEVISHHLSHAYNGFISSGFDESLICVIDNTGNKLTEEKTDVWDAGFERNSYYHAFWKDGKPILKLIEREANTSDKIGYGEAYRYFTHYFGWDSYKHAGKTMGLAPYGNPNAFKGIKLFEKKENEEVCLLGSKHSFPEEELKDFFKKNDINLPRKLYKNELVKQYYADMAYFLQKEFEKSFLRRILGLKKKYNFKNIVISGGVALNCVVNGLLFNHFKKMYVPSAPGDEGQSLGNAFYGYYNYIKNEIPKQLTNSFYGKGYEFSDWEDYAKEKKLKITKIKNIEKKVAKLLTKKNIIGWYQGNSEFGARALGHRSIIADPRFDFMKERINSQIKFREPFRPFAPSFLEQYQEDYFENKNIKSYFMSFAFPVKSKMQRFVPAITHVDGTARLQTVSEDSDKKYHKLITEFYNLTKIPCILNTSFNLNDEPIVETPINAINTFLKCHMDYLVINDYLIEKPSRQDKDEYLVEVIIKKGDKYMITKKDDSQESLVIEEDVLPNETIPHAVVRSVQEALRTSVFIKARVFEDLYPEKDKIIHKIYFIVEPREDIFIPNKKIISNYSWKNLDELNNKKYFTKLPIFVKNFIKSLL